MIIINDEIFVSVLVLVIVIVAALLMINAGISDDLGQIVGSLPIITLSATKHNEFGEALVSFSAGDEKKLDAWLESLKGERRFGILPALPAEYHNPGVVESNGKWVLCPRLPEEK